MEPPYTKKLSKERKVLDELAVDLESTANFVQSSVVQLAQIKVEIKHLVDTVKELKGGNGGGSIVTRLAIAEQAITEIKKYITEDAKSGTDILMKVTLLEEKVADATKAAIDASKAISKKQIIDVGDEHSKWKVWGLAITGGFTFLGSLVSLIMHLLNNI